MRAQHAIESPALRHLYLSLFYEQAFFIRNAMTLRESLAAQEAFNRSTRPIGQLILLSRAAQDAFARTHIQELNMPLACLLKPAALVRATLADLLRQPTTFRIILKSHANRTKPVSCWANELGHRKSPPRRALWVLIRIRKQNLKVIVDDPYTYWSSFSLAAS